MEGIEINKVYNYFDDGKIKESRKVPVLIKEIIPFEDIDSETYLLWIEELEQHTHLYKQETDYFIKGDLQLDAITIEKIVFVRTLENGWFSIGIWGGRLDFDFSLTKKLNDKKSFGE
jgi:hypothetical protein